MQRGQKLVQLLNRMLFPKFPNVVKNSLEDQFAVEFIDHPGKY